MERVIGASPYPKKMVISLIIAVLVVLYTTICAYAFVRQEQYIFHPEQLPVDYPFKLRGTFTEKWIPSGDAVLHALHFTVPNPAGVVLYFHGNSGCLKQWGRVAEAFTKSGYDVVLLDYRGYGKSTGQIRSEANLLQDAEAAYQAVAQDYAEDKIVLYGRSLGSGLAVYLASIRKPGRLVLETPYYSVVDLLRRLCPILPPFLLRYTARSDQWIRNVSCPVILFHGDKDALIPYDSSVRLLSLIPTQAKLITIVGGAHNNLGSFRTYWDGLREVFGTNTGH